jgi:hypothetical protein
MEVGIQVLMHVHVGMVLSITLAELSFFLYHVGPIPAEVATWV